MRTYPFISNYLQSSGWELANRQAPTALIWLACDHASLARDLKPFLDVGFWLHSLALFDCFTYTTHSETVALLGCLGTPNSLRR